MLTKTQSDLLAKAIYEQTSGQNCDSNDCSCSLWKSPMSTFNKLLKLGFIDHTKIGICDVYKISASGLKYASDNNLSYSPVKHHGNCPKCNGTGYLPEYAFNGGICYKCNGKGNI